MTEIKGDRVYVVLSADEDKIVSFGRGTHVGMKMNEELGFENPCIVLDNGYICWGYQTWWGPEDGFEEWLGDRKVIDVPEDIYKTMGLTKDLPEGVGEPDPTPAA